MHSMQYVQIEYQSQFLVPWWCKHSGHYSFILSFPSFCLGCVYVFKCLSDNDEEVEAWKVNLEIFCQNYKGWLFLSYICSKQQFYANACNVLVHVAFCQMSTSSSKFVTSLFVQSVKWIKCIASITSDILHRIYCN